MGGAKATPHVSDPRVSFLHFAQDLADEAGRIGSRIAPISTTWMRHGNDGSPVARCMRFAQPTPIIRLAVGTDWLDRTEQLFDQTARSAAKANDRADLQGVDNCLVNRPAFFNQGIALVPKVSFVSGSREDKIACRDLTGIEAEPAQHVQDPRLHPPATGRRALP